MTTKAPMPMTKLPAESAAIKVLEPGVMWQRVDTG